MNKLYSFALGFILLLFAGGCSKDFLKSYEDRIIGTWELEDIDRVGWGGNNRDHPFTNGQFTFEESGSVTWINSAGTLYKGTWDIRKEWISDCNGNDCDDRQVKALLITAVDFNNQDIRSEYFEEMRFTGTNSFKAFVSVGNRRYVFYFRR